MMLLKVIDDVKKPAKEEIIKPLTTLKDFKGVTGNISFDKNGDAIKSVVILRLEKDGAKYITTINP